MNSSNPYETDLHCSPVQSTQQYSSFVRVACIGALSASALPCFFAILSSIAWYRDPSNNQSMHAIRMWAVAIVLTAIVGALLGIAVTLFRLLIVPNNRTDSD